MSAVGNLVVRGRIHSRYVDRLLLAVVDGGVVVAGLPIAVVGTALDGAIGIDALGDGCCGAEVVDIDYSGISVAVVIAAVGLSIWVGMSPRLRRLE